MRNLVLLLQSLGEKATRTDIWTICIVVTLVWALIKCDTELLTWIIGFMFADLGVKKYAEVQKAKHYAETTRENKSYPRDNSDIIGGNGGDVDTNKPPAE